MQIHILYIFGVYIHMLFSYSSVHVLIVYPFSIFLCHHFPENSDACGIFVLKWLENWRSRNALQSVFRQEMVKDARIRLAVDILFSKHNIIEEGKRLVKNL